MNTCSRCNYSGSPLELGRHSKLEHPVTEKEGKEIYDMYLKGVSNNSISQIFVRSASTIKSVINRVSPKKYDNTQEDVHNISKETTFPSPAEYVAAFEARVLEFRKILVEKDSKISFLENKIENLMRELTETKKKITEIKFTANQWIKETLAGRSIDTPLR